MVYAADLFLFIHHFVFSLYNFVMIHSLECVLSVFNMLWFTATVEKNAVILDPVINSLTLYQFLRISTTF